MMIERLGPVDPLSPLNSSGKPARTGKTEKNDAINLSSEAKEKGDIYRAVEVAKTASDVRPDKIAEIKKKLENPAYIDEKVLGTVADRVMDMFGL